jgi:heme-degrading monooxygenase HmoA
MTTIGMNYDVLPGKEDVFVSSFKNVLALLRTLPDHVDSKLYRDTESANQFLIVSQWKTQAAFTDFIRSQAFKDVTAWGKAEILADRPKHTVYNND